MMGITSCICRRVVTYIAYSTYTLKKTANKQVKQGGRSHIHRASLEFGGFDELGGGGGGGGGVRSGTETICRVTLHVA